MTVLSKNKYTGPLMVSTDSPFYDIGPTDSSKLFQASIYVEKNCFKMSRRALRS